MSGSDKLPRKPAERAEIDAFLDKVAKAPVQATAGGRGRLMFGMDATASRRPTWDRAARLQGPVVPAATRRRWWYRWW